MFIINNDYEKLNLSNLNFDCNGTFNGFLPFCLQIKEKNHINDPHIIAQSSISHHDLFSDFKSSYINSSLYLHNLKNKFNFEDGMPFQFYQFNKEKEVFNLKEITYENDEQFHKEISNAFKDIESKHLISFFSKKEGFISYFKGVFEFYIDMPENVIPFENNINQNIKKANNNFKMNKKRVWEEFNNCIDTLYSDKNFFVVKDMEQFIYVHFSLTFLYAQGIINELDFNDVDIENKLINMEESLTNFRNKIRK